MFDIGQLLRKLYTYKLFGECLLVPNPSIVCNCMGRRDATHDWDVANM